MSLLSWAREKFGWGWGSAPLLHSSGNWAGKTVTADGAMQLSAWFRAVRLYAEVTGSLPLKFYERREDGSRIQVRSHPIAEIIALDPNIDQTTQEFWGCQAAALAIFGNAYAEKLFSGSRLVGLQPLPYDTHPHRDEKWELYYRFNNGGKTETLPRDKVFHTKGFSLGGDLGISPLEAARQGLSISLATEQATGQTFSQGLRMSGFFTIPNRATPQQRLDFAKTYIDPITGNDARAHYGLLEQDSKFTAIHIPPKDAEMLLSRRHNIEEIARFMGVPPILIGHSSEGQTMWGSGVEAIMLSWLSLGLNSFLSNIEKSINKRLLNPADRKKFFAEFDRNALLQADSAGRAEMYWKLIQIAAITPNKVCDKENFERFEGGDVRLVNSTLTKLELLGQKPPARIQPAPGEPIPEPDDPEDDSGAPAAPPPPP